MGEGYGCSTLRGCKRYSALAEAKRGSKRKLVIQWIVSAIGHPSHPYVEEQEEKRMWISVKDSLPEEHPQKWYIIQTQDGTVYPAKYTTIFVGGKPKTDWSPIFRGGTVEALMHGSVAFWQDHEDGYEYVKCTCGRFYLKYPGIDSCPLCEAFKPKKQEKAVKEEPKPVAEPVEEIMDFPEDDAVLADEAPVEDAPVEEKPVEKKPVAKKPATRKPATRTAKKK